MKYKHSQVLEHYIYGKCKVKRIDSSNNAYYVTFENGDALWVMEGELKPIKKKGC